MSQEPWVILCESVPVSLGSDGGVQEAVLNSHRRTDVFIQELLPCLLGDGFSRHFVTYTKRHTDTMRKKLVQNQSCKSKLFKLYSRQYAVHVDLH